MRTPASAADTLKPYKATISRWLYPDVFSNQNISGTKAKKTIPDYKKAIGQTEGFVELLTEYQIDGKPPENYRHCHYGIENTSMLTGHA